MKDLKTKMDEIALKVVTRTVRDELEEWPPQSIALFYQPMRPKKETTNATTPSK